jgi:hypothetical protein
MITLTGAMHWWVFCLVLALAGFCWTVGAWVAGRLLGRLS